MATEPRTTTAPAPTPVKPPVAPAPVTTPLEGAEAIADLQRRMARVESLMPVAVGLPLPPFPDVRDDDLENEIAAKEAELIALRAKRTGGLAEWPKWVKDGAGNDAIAESPEHEAELQKIVAPARPTAEREPPPVPPMPPPAARRPPASSTTVAG